MGHVINGQTTSVPSNLSVVSFEANTTGKMFMRITLGTTEGPPHANGSENLGELIVYNSALSDSDIAKVEGYLAHKWGLVNSLDSGHTYKSVVPASQLTWSQVQSFTTPTNVTVPVLGSLSTANLTTTTADLESTLSDNGNAATSLVFYWGDNDGGTNPSSWDSNFTVSNAQEGTLRKSLSGLTSGNTYYFRSFASNWKGNVWASTTRSFTTVTSTTRDTPVRNSDLKGWWKLDGNFKDSSGNNHHGDAEFVFNPENLNNLQFWLDAKDISSITKDSSNRVQQWKDRRGTSLSVSQTTDNRKPIYNVSGFNSMPTLSFDGSNDYLEKGDGNPTFGTTDLDSVASEAWTVFAVGKAGTGSAFQNGGWTGFGFCW